jgi:protein-tyrosine phosphatase
MDGNPESGRRRRGLHRALWIGGAGVALLLGVGWDSEYFSLRDRLFPRRFETVIPGRLFRSGQIAARLIDSVLERERIAVVVDLTAADAADADQSAERAAVKRLEVDYHRCPLKGDGTGDVAEYADAVAAIKRGEDESKPVLVHCAAGDKRSGGVVAAYLMLFQGATADCALDEIGRCSKGGTPSSTVVDYLNAHLAEIARRLEQQGFTLASGMPLPRLTGGG